MAKLKLPAATQSLQDGLATCAGPPLSVCFNLEVKFNCFDLQAVPWSELASKNKALAFKRFGLPYVAPVRRGLPWVGRMKGQALSSVRANSKNAAVPSRSPRT